jgi:hypothetical protein
MKLPFFRKRLSADAFADLVIREVTGRAPSLELRIIEPLSLRVVAADTTEQQIHLDRAFDQYLDNPRELDEVVGRWASVIVGGTIRQDKLDLAAVVPIVKARRWIDSQRAYHVEQFGTDKAFSLCWETYNAELIVAYAEFNSGLRFVRAEELEANGLDMAALRHLATKNLAERTRELRYMGGGSEVVVICAEGNLEPSLILLDEVWQDPRARVDGDRLVTIAERGFTITAGTENLRHVWQLAADAAVSYRKAQYAVSPHLFEQRGLTFELVDGGEDDESHAIPSPSNLDIHAVKRGGGSDLVIIVATPLLADTRSVYRLFQKIDNYLQFIAGDAYKKECGNPSKESTRIIVRAHDETDPAMFELLDSVGDWVASRNASLVVEALNSSEN